MNNILLVTGGSGLVGNAIQYCVKEKYNDFFSKTFYLSSKDADLNNFEDTLNIFEKIIPTHVIHLAANVGGLYKNLYNKVEMFETNMLININVLRCCHKLNVDNLICCLSTCIFPDKTTYPIDETMLHNGPPHYSNNAYAYAKRMLECQCSYYNENFKRKYKCVIPTNIYGPYDNYNLVNAHVIPALIHKCYISKQENKPFVIKGSGKPLRQFIYSKDLAELILWTMFHYNDLDSIILSVSEKHEISIKDVALTIAKEFNYDNIIFDSSFEDGQYKKTASNEKLMKLYNYKFTPFNIGIKESVSWFIRNFDNCRK
jgi:GDP-L-fucose synthase